MAKILFVSSLAHGGTCEMRRQALERLGHSTFGYSYESGFAGYSRSIRRIQWHSRTGPALARIQRDMLDAAVQFDPDLVWAEKAWFLWPETLVDLRRRGVQKLILYSPDNYFIRQNYSRHLWNGLSLYDLVVTTKSFNVTALKERGAKKVLLSGNAFDPLVHRPVVLTRQEGEDFSCDVSFVGRWEPEREAWLEKVAHMGVKLSVWGTQWHCARAPCVKTCFRGGAALQEDYAKAICGSKINLCFLSRIAKDAITQRSVEIPACAGFMLAERTQEHLNHFREGVEAAYYSDLNEMLSQIRRYLSDDDGRHAIRLAGRQRCLNSGYSYDDRMREILT